MKGSDRSGAGRTAALAAAFVVPRLLLLATSSGAEFDMHSYALVEASQRLGTGLYSSPALDGRYPYLPAWALLLQVLGALNRAFGGAPWLWFKLPGVVAEWLILRMLLRSEPGERGFRRAWLWALSPVAWLVTSGHGQFDAVVLCFLLGALLVAEQGLRGRGWKAGLCVGAAIAFKTWPLVLLPVFWQALDAKAERRWFLLGAVGLPIALLAPYLLSEGPAPVLSHLVYTGFSGVGLPAALKQLGVRWIGGHFSGLPLQLWTWMSLAGLGLAWLAAWRWPWRWPLRLGVAGVVLGLVVLGPAISAQYLLWPVPFLILCAPGLALSYQAGATVLLLVYYGVGYPSAIYRDWRPLPVGPAGMAAWGFANALLWAWMAWCLIRLMRDPVNAAHGDQ